MTSLMQPSATVARRDMTQGGVPLMRCHVERRWSFVLDRRGLAITSVKRWCEDHVPDRSNPAARSGEWRWAAGALVGLGLAGLATVGAVAGNDRRADPAPYLVSMAIPERALTSPVRPGLPVKSGALASLAAERLVPTAPAPEVVNTASVATTDAATQEARFVDAMKTGDVQEWRGGDGRSRFLVAGQLLPKDGRLCRSLALLIRGDGGESEVSSSERCEAAGEVDAAGD